MQTTKHTVGGKHRYVICFHQIFFFFSRAVFVCVLTFIFFISLFFFAYNKQKKCAVAKVTLLRSTTAVYFIQTQMPQQVSRSQVAGSPAGMQQEGPSLNSDRRRYLPLLVSPLYLILNYVAGCRRNATLPLAFIDEARRRFGMPGARAL